MAKGKSMGDLATEATATQPAAPEPVDMQALIAVARRAQETAVAESIAALKEWMRREVHLAMQGHSPETRAKLNP